MVETDQLHEQEIKWRWKPFVQLTPIELEQMYRLRQAVFVVEQNCPYLDVDGLDPNADHLLGYWDEQIVATLRFFISLPGAEGVASLGRVCTAKAVRGRGVGHQLMHQAMDFYRQTCPTKPLQISAQSYLEKFYQSFGFVSCSEEYLEDDIPHVTMRLEPANK